MKLFIFNATYCDTDMMIGIIANDSETAESLNSRYNGREGIKKLGNPYWITKEYFGYPIRTITRLILDDKMNEILWIK